MRAASVLGVVAIAACPGPAPDRCERWLLKNSWGAAGNGNGYFETNYGACAVDAGASAIDDVIAP